MEIKKRLELVDSLRGLTIISMIAFHTCWFLGYFNMGITMDQLYGTSFFIWERSICCSFIFISGFSFSLGHHHLKRGLLILSIGVLITIGSLFLPPEMWDIFGVLWVLGISQLILILEEKIEFNKNSKIAVLSFFLSIVLFIYTWNINKGYLGFRDFLYLEMPKELYSGYFMTFLGFMDPNFYSVDYFSIFPWIFLDFSGYYFSLIIRNTVLEEKYLVRGNKILSWMGRHSLIIYLAHPVIIFVVIFILNFLLF